MSRGAEYSTRKLTDEQLAQQNQLISQANQQDQSGSRADDAHDPEPAHQPGYTPQQQSDITQQSLGAANTAFDALRQSAANRVAATNNSAGYGDLLGAARPPAGADRRQPDAAESNLLRQPAAQGTARRTERARANLRRRYQPARQSDGRSVGTARRAPARVARQLDGRPRRPLRPRLEHRLAFWIIPGFAHRVLRHAAADALASENRTPLERVDHRAMPHASMRGRRGISLRYERIATRKNLAGDPSLPTSGLRMTARQVAIHLWKCCSRRRRPPSFNEGRSLAEESALSCERHLPSITPAFRPFAARENHSSVSVMPLRQIEERFSGASLTSRPSGLTRRWQSDVSPGESGAPMHLLLNPPWWTLGVSSLVQLVLFVRWIYRRIRNDEITAPLRS